MAPSNWGCAKAHFNIGIFPFAQCTDITQLVSGFLLEGIALCVTIDLVYPEKEVSLGDSYIAVLDWDSNEAFLKKRKIAVNFQADIYQKKPTF